MCADGQPAVRAPAREIRPGHDVGGAAQVGGAADVVMMLALQARSSSPAFTPAAKVRHCRAVKTSAGPLRFLESRTAIMPGGDPVLVSAVLSSAVPSRAAPGTGATSTQLPFAPL
jgi:hypothetical protein